MADAIDPETVDKRTWQRYVQMGLLDEKSYERHLKALPDASDKGAPMDATFEPSDTEEKLPG